MTITLLKSWLTFGGNEATKKTQKTLLKQLYENFSATSTESLDSIFNRLQKLVSQLVVLGVFFSQEDLNLKFLKSLPSGWNIHVVVWRNKSDLDTMSLDDLYNNFKIVEQEKTSKKITINGSDTAGYNKAKVECFNYHQMRHFARECRVPRNQKNKTRNQETAKRTMNVEDTSSKAMVVIDGAGFDWSYMADDESPTNMAFMALSNSKGHSHKQLEDQGYFDSGCYRYMTGNISYLTDFKEFDGGYVAFRGGAKGGKITRKGTIKTVTKDETSRILKSFITKIENLVDNKVKIIRCDNETKFKNRVMKEFCEEKGIKREYSVARTPQQNRVAERKNRTLIEATRTMLADSKLPITFWVEAVNTACYV
nr:ribonuclease H-like domain-containing protein [Tanacetum cinerariifolium]